MYLDEISPVLARVGYGSLGRGGSLGYDGKNAIAGGRHYRRALGTHPPARLVFRLDGRFANFRSAVALADDVRRGQSDATFVVLADGREVARVEQLAGELPQLIDVSVAGTSLLELTVETSRFHFSHAVWLDPMLEEDPAGVAPFIDCLNRAEILRTEITSVDRCIATVVSPGFTRRLDDMLGSLVANGNCRDALLVVFALPPYEASARVAAKYDAVMVKCRSIGRVNPTTKAILYSAAHIVPAWRFLCLDADIIVTDDISPLFAALDALPASTILACRNSNRRECTSLGDALRQVYGGNNYDRAGLKITDSEMQYPLIVNDGVFAASRQAMLDLDALLRGMPYARDFLGLHPIRNQFLFNLALARLGCGVELDNAYNLQLHPDEVEIDFEDNGLPTPAYWNERPVRVLHFSGGSKSRYRERQGHYASVAKPLLGPSPTDSYTDFLAALYRWVGTRGADALRGGASATLMLAALHYLVRSNACTRVVECGTGRGVATACLASAVSSREGGSVVTFDAEVDADRDTLWDGLPLVMRRRIEARRASPGTGMRASFLMGERFDAALIAAKGSESETSVEIALARRIVHPDGLILVHDAASLWTAETYGTAAIIQTSASAPAQ